MLFCSLLHLEAGTNSMVNDGVQNFDDQIKIYLLCAHNLQRSLQERSLHHVIFTNNGTLLNEVARNLSIELNIQEIKFHLDVPRKIKFYSVHFRVELFQALSNLLEDYIILIDCDCIALNPPPSVLQRIVESKTPMRYDISDQVIPAYTHEKIFRNMTRLSDRIRIGFWSGGEFFGGTPQFFHALHEQIMTFYDKYISDFHNFHQSDEMLNSVALELMQKDWNIIDAGKLNIVQRYWSVDTLHIQKPLESNRSTFILHLPADKLYLAYHPFSENFFDEYVRHVNAKRAIGKRSFLGRAARKIAQPFRHPLAQK